MDKTPAEATSLTDHFFTWVQSHPEQVVLVVVTYVIAFVLIKKDKLT